nr:uncharacterized protein LOC126517805 [Dermacentor andersoni]
MAEESSNEYTPLDLSMKNEAAPSTSRDGTQGASSTLGAYRTNADDALRYQGKTHHTPMTDETCSVDGVTDNGSTRCQHLGSIRSIDNVRPSTSRAGMEEASAKFEDSATNATGTRGREQQVLCGASGKVFSRRDTSHGQPNEITDRTAPMLRAQRPQYFGVSASGMDEQRNDGHTPPAFTFIDKAIPHKSREGGEGALGTSDDYLTYIDEYINDAFKALNRQTDATDVNDAAESGSTNDAPVVSTASADHARPSTSRAGIAKVSLTTKDTAR